MLKTIKVSEEGMSQAETGWKLGFLPQTVSEAVNTKEKFLKEIRSATPVNTQMIRKQNSFLADMETVGVWRENQTSHNIPLSRSLIQARSYLSSILWRPRELRKLQKKNCEISWHGLMSFRKEAIFMTWKCKGKQQALGAEATVSYLEDLAKTTNEGGYTEQQIFK